MTGRELTKYRRQKNKTQVQMAKALGVSQTYLSLLESGKRPMTERLQRKAARFLDLRPTELPSKLQFGEPPRATDADLAAELADLGYPGFSHLRRKRPSSKNPADVLLSALNAPQRDARVVEGLPWLVFTFPDLDWPSTARMAKAYDLQNRLGFVVNLARRSAEARSEDDRTVLKLKEFENALERSRLAREDTLCNDSMTRAERDWLAKERPHEAKHWNLLTGLSPRHLSYFHAD